MFEKHFFSEDFRSFRRFFPERKIKKAFEDIKKAINTNDPKMTISKIGIFTQFKIFNS